MTLGPDDLPDRLKKEYLAGRLAVFVGAGASQGAGYPSWGGFLEQLTDRAVGEKLLTKEVEAEVRDLIASGSRPLMVAGKLKSALGAEWVDAVSDIFDDCGKKPTPLHEAIFNLDKSPFFVTTNYDNLLEEAYIAKRRGAPPVYTFKNSGEIRRRMMRRDFFILKAHGSVSSIGDGIILTTNDYRRLAFEERAYQAILSSIFTTYTVLFVGVSLTDPEVNNLLDYIADAFPPTGAPVHYALIPDDKMNSVEIEQWRESYHISIIQYSPANGHSQLVDAMRALAGSV